MSSLPGAPEVQTFDQYGSYQKFSTKKYVHLKTKHFQVLPAVWLPIRQLSNCLGFAVQKC